MKFRIRVPATSANIGPGFDSLGMALSLYNIFEVEISDHNSVSGCDEKYSGPDNLFLKALRAGFSRLAKPCPAVAVHIDAHIPLARGLGSSAAMIAGGVAASLFLDAASTGKGMADEGGCMILDDVQRQVILEISADLEGHPDNVAPAIYGGFCATAKIKTSNSAIRKHGSALSIAIARSRIREDWRFHALIPSFELSTDKARAVLPNLVSRSDAVFNIGRSALLALAFEKGDLELLALACEDRIHQPYRMALIPGYEAMIEASMACGAKGCWLSGSGPTIMAITGADTAVEFREKMEQTMTRVLDSPWKHLVLHPDRDGIQVSRL
jgi:homoserine kinase